MQWAGWVVLALYARCGSGIDRYDKVTIARTSHAIGHASTYRSGVPNRRTSSPDRSGVPPPA